MKVLSVLKELKSERHYTLLHAYHLNKYQGPATITLVEDYKKKWKWHMGVFTKVTKINILMHDIGLPLWLNLILPSSGVLCGVRRFEIA
jgi:hypothetical protein